MRRMLLNGEEYREKNEENYQIGDRMSPCRRITG